MSDERQVEFEIGQRTYRVNVSIISGMGLREINGFNALRDNVGIYDDLISGEKIFVAWSQVPVLRIAQAS